jgi:hypothetical protein
MSKQTKHIYSERREWSYLHNLLLQGSFMLASVNKEIEIVQNVALFKVIFVDILTLLAVLVVFKHFLRSVTGECLERALLQIET